MKIIVFGDIHMAADAARHIPGITSADLVLINGDLTNYGGKNEARTVLDTVLALNPGVLAQFGNLDQPEVNDYLENLGLNLHGQARLVQGRVCLVGVGGSNPTPFRTPSEFSETELHALAEQAFRQGLEFTELAEPLHGRKIPTIFISHTPPHGTQVDRLSSGVHVGSTAIRTLIEQYRPALCVTGHIHEAQGRDTIGDTVVVNPGMLSAGGWVTITVNEAELDISLS
ncbi:MAG TPA: metallophosphoesterase [Desulforhopalus sp.]|jgi:uncharacterized protein|nr:metallophosphoesterase [Desulforhopalus sp.]